MRGDVRDIPATAGHPGAVARYFNRSARIPNSVPACSFAAHPCLGKIIQAYEEGIPGSRSPATDYPTRDGTGIRDYIHVLGPGHRPPGALGPVRTRSWRGGRHVQRHQPGHRTGTTVRELLDAFNQVADRPVKVLRRGRRPGDLAGTYTRGDRVAALPELEPRYSIAEGIRHSLDWAAIRGWDSGLMTSFRRMAGPPCGRSRPARGVLRRQPNVVETGAAQGATLASSPCRAPAALTVRSRPSPTRRTDGPGPATPVISLPLAVADSLAAPPANQRPTSPHGAHDDVAVTGHVAGAAVRLGNREVDVSATRPSPLVVEDLLPRWSSRCRPERCRRCRTRSGALADTESRWSCRRSWSRTAASGRLRCARCFTGGCRRCPSRRRWRGTRRPAASPRSGCLQ